MGRLCGPGVFGGRTELARLFVFVGGLIVLALTAALVGPYFVDWTSYRADFEREASRILGRQVDVQGSASARLLPFPSVTFTDVVVAGNSPERPAMTIETFSMDAELAPFLRGEVLIFDMRLVRPHANIAIAEDGMINWAVRPSAPVGAEHISLEKLTITEGKATLHHAGSGRTHIMSEINAVASARSLAGPWRMDGSMRLDGMKTALSVSTGKMDETGAMRLRVSAEPERYPIILHADGSTQLEEGRPIYAGQFTLAADRGGDAREGQDEAEQPPAYRFSGQFAFDPDSIGVEEFRFETGPEEDPYIAEGSAQFDLGAEPSFLVRADGAQVRFEDAAGARDKGGEFSLRQRLAAFSDFMLDVPRPTIAGKVEVNLPAIVAGDTTVRDVHLSAEPSPAGWRIASLGASLPGRTTLEAEGELAVGDELGFEGSLLLAVGQPSGFAAWLARDVDDAIRRLPSAGFSAEVRLSEERQLFRNLELILGDARFTGEIDHRQPSDSKPSMSLTLDGEALDVEGMAAFASLFISEDGENRLADHDLSFDIKAGPVTAAGLSADSLDTSLRLKDGALEIDRLTIGGLAGANVSATGSIRNLDDSPTGNLDAAIVAADLEPLATVLARRYPDNWLARELARRAELYPGLLTDAEIDIVASAAASDEGETGLAISATGAAGGSDFTLTATAENIRDGFSATPLGVKFSVRNDEAAAIYALLGLPTLPIAYAGAAEAEFDLDGILEEGASARGTVEGEGLAAAFDGQLAFRGEGLALRGSGRLEADDLGPWLMTAGMGLPGVAQGLPVSATSELDYGDGLLVLSGLSGELAGITLNGDVNAEVEDGLPHLTGALSAEALDLGLIAEMIVGADALAGGGEDWPSAPFAQSVSTPFTADFDLAVARLHGGRLVSLSDARLKLRLDRQGFAVSDFSAGLHDGRANGLFEFRNDGGTGLFSGQFRLEDADLARVTGGPALRGAVDLAASVTASGKSVEGIVSSLAGSGTASLRNLVIAGINPEGIEALLARADSFGAEIDAAATADLAPGIVRGGAFRAEGLDLAFTIANGVVRAPPFRIETQEATLAGEIRADLGASTVSAEATLTYDPGLEAVVGSEPAVRFVVQGPLEDPVARIETAALAQFLTQRALEREQARVEAMQAQLLEKQRHRREARYYAALHDERVRAEKEARRAEEEAERLRTEEERRRRAEEETLRFEAAEERRNAEEEARAAEAEAERAAEERRIREENERLRAEVEALIRERAQRATGQSGITEPTPLPPPPVEVRPEIGDQSSATSLPGVSQIFTEENLSVDNFLSPFGE